MTSEIKQNKKMLVKSIVWFRLEVQYEEEEKVRCNFNAKWIEIEEITRVHKWWDGVAGATKTTTTAVVVVVCQVDAAALAICTTHKRIAQWI